MGEVHEYYLASGRLRIGKKELTFELLRKDSILRVFLGFDTGNLKTSSPSESKNTDHVESVLIDFGAREKVKLEGDPTPLLKELKNRYGNQIGGALNFIMFNTTFQRTTHLQADLGATPIILQMIAEYR